MIKNVVCSLVIQFHPIPKDENQNVSNSFSFGLNGLESTVGAVISVGRSTNAQCTEFRTDNSNIVSDDHLMASLRC